MIADSRDGPLAELGVKKFVQAVGARSATPGGGSVAALVGSLVCINGGRERKLGRDLLPLGTDP